MFCIFLYYCVNIFNKDLVDLCTLFIFLEFSTDQKNYKRFSEVHLSKRGSKTLQSLVIWTSAPNAITTSESPKKPPSNPKPPLNLLLRRHHHHQRAVERLHRLVPRRGGAWAVTRKWAWWGLSASVGVHSAETIDIPRITNASSISEDKEEMRLAKLIPWWRVKRSRDSK